MSWAHPGNLLRRDPADLGDRQVLAVDHPVREECRLIPGAKRRQRVRELHGHPRPGGRSTSSGACSASPTRTTTVRSSTGTSLTVDAPASSTVPVNTSPTVLAGL